MKSDEQMSSDRYYEVRRFKTAYYFSLLRKKIVLQNTDISSYTKWQFKKGTRELNHFIKQIIHGCDKGQKLDERMQTVNLINCELFDLVEEYYPLPYHMKRKKKETKKEYRNRKAQASSFSTYSLFMFKLFDGEDKLEIWCQNHLVLVQIGIPLFVLLLVAGGVYIASNIVLKFIMIFAFLFLCIFHIMSLLRRNTEQALLYQKVYRIRNNNTYLGKKSNQILRTSTHSFMDKLYTVITIFSKK